MASLLFKEKKGVNFSCVSPASAAICTSIDRRSMVQPSTGRALDRHTPHLRDPRRAARATPTTRTAVANSVSLAQPTKPKTSGQLKSRKNLVDQRPNGGGGGHGGTFSAPGSTRYLLGDEYENGGDDGGGGIDAYLSGVLAAEEAVADEPFPPLISLEPPPPPTLQALMREEKVARFMKPPPLLSSAPPRPQHHHHQVVALRVSLHCKGCEGKVRKHISKMQGVRSFEIDFKTKKVTVVGDVTPLGVLSSISKVKHAQFWPSSPPPPAPRASDSQLIDPLHMQFVN